MAVRGETGNTGKMGKTGIMGIRVRVRYAELQNGTKRAKARTRNRNVTENIIGVLQMKIEQGQMRPCLGN